MNSTYFNGTLFCGKMPEAIHLMRIILIALPMTLALQARAYTKKYIKKECNEILSTIDLFLSTTPILLAELVKTLPTIRRPWSYHGPWS